MNVELTGLSGHVSGVPQYSQLTETDIMVIRSPDWCRNPRVANGGAACESGPAIHSGYLSEGDTLFLVYQCLIQQLLKMG